MATMYVYNIPTNETVNLRKTPESTGTILVRVGYGKAVQASSYNETWHSASYNGYSGYIMSKYLTSTDPNGSSGGTTGSITAGHYVKMNQSNSYPVNVRASTSTSSERLGQLQKGTLMYCEDVVTVNGTTWAKIRWGGRSATYAYIMTKYLADGGIASSNKKLRAIAIANSMKDSGYPDQPEEYLDIDHGEWCVRYVSFLMKAAGCSSGNYVPFSDAKVSEAVAFFQNKNAFGTRANKTPSEGDWVFFSQGSETYQHVGFIVKVTGTNITTVEGNLGKTITTRGPSSYNGKFGEMTG